MSIKLSWIGCFIVTMASGQTPGGPKNSDFEEGDIGDADAGWFVPPAVADSYEAAFVSEGAKKGKRCALLSSKSEPAGQAFGNLMQPFDAKPYRGQRVRFRAFVKTDLEGPMSRAQLWLRVDRDGGKMGFFDNMGNRPIKSSKWKEYTISGPIADDAATINIGCMLLGQGKVWIDAVKFETAGKAGEGVEKPKALSTRGMENMIALARLLGYVRHFHPSDAAAKTDWDDLAIRAVRYVEGAKDATELAEKLGDVFEPIAPTVRVYVKGAKPALPKELEPPTNVEESRVTAWRHLGFGNTSVPKEQAVYRSERIEHDVTDGKLPTGVAKPGKPLTVDLGGGVTCSVPLALYVDDEGTLPHGKPKSKLPKHPDGFTPMGGDRATRLADVMLIWNIHQHFYPYFDVVKTDWPAALHVSLKSAATDVDETAFLQTLRRLIAQLHDGHGSVSGPGSDVSARLPFLWDWVEDSLVITRIGHDYEGKIKPGDVVVKIDGKPAQDVLEKQEEMISGATPQWIRFNALRHLAAGENNSTMRFDIRAADGSMFSEKVTRRSSERPPEEKRPKPIAEVKPGIMYVDLGRITDDDFKKALPQLEKAKGIVMDMRGYPSRLSPSKAIGCFLDEKITCPQWHIPVVTRPDRQGMTFQFSNWPVLPAEPRLKARVAYIIDGRAISYAETWMGMIEHYKLAAIVGGPTAGTNGNVNPISLPGGYSVSWTGMKVLKHDGAQHHGVGIQPTIPMHRTIKGVREGRDELLERAILATQTR